MQFNVHLNFNGKCEEAFAYYARHLGAKVEVMLKWDDMPGPSQPAMKGKIMHGRLTIGGTLAMGADSPPAMYKTPQGMTVSMSTETAAEAERAFAALSDGGAVSMPLAETFFAHKFGMVTDRYGIPWMVVNPKEM